MDRHKVTKTKLLIGVFLFGIFYRLLLYFVKMKFFPPTDSELLLSFPDEYKYHYIGTAMSGSWQEFIAYVKSIKYIYGWHVFVGFVYRLFGPSPLFIKGINIVISSLVPIVGFRIAKEFFSRKAAVWALVLLALSPSLAWFSIFILKDSMLAFLFILFTYALLELRKTRAFSYFLMSLILLIALVTLKLQLVIICLAMLIFVLFKVIKTKFLFISILIFSLIGLSYFSEHAVLRKILASEASYKITFLSSVKTAGLKSHGVIDVLTSLSASDVAASIPEYLKKLTAFWIPIPTDANSLLALCLVLPFNMFLFSFFFLGTFFIYKKVKNTALNFLLFSLCANWLLFSLAPEPHWRYRLIAVPLVIIISSVYIEAVERSYFAAVKTQKPERKNFG
ncbi:MAG: glycosyltransferase family 39 protein [Candidatus Omnitrophica bacterium]|nr:glycosyltransferase family 39 protein [Candidatus Omnitrophota bacterium]